MYSFDANYRASPKSSKRGEEKKKFLGAWKIMHNSDLKHLEFEEFNNKFMLVSIL